MSDPAHPVWRVNPTCHLFWKNWESDCQERTVLFNAASSETHWLNELSAQTLRLLVSERLSRTDLTSRFTTIYEDFPLDDEMNSYIQDVLLRLEEQGLIEPVPC